MENVYRTSEEPLPVIRTDEEPVDAEATEKEVSLEFKIPDKPA